MPVPHEPHAVERELMRDTAYRALRDAIVGGTLHPGEQLHDAELCAWLGLSRTPVREALGRLEDEGLVESAPQRFTRVTRIQVADAHDAFPLLATLHALATELGVPRLDREDLARLRTENDAFLAALKRQDGPSAYGADDRFHDVFVRTCGNAELPHVIARLLPRVHRFERLRDGALPGRRSVAQHEAVIARAGVGDARGAASAVHENWLELGGLVARSLAARSL
jgi:DNA-binding GntR family transcriptional regulator